MQGIDSYVGRIALDSADTVSFDLGLYSNNLEEDVPALIPKSHIKYFNETDLAEPYVVIIEDADTLLNPETFKKNVISYEKVDTYQAKLVRPKKSGIGTTGVYIDSLWSAGDSKGKFQLSGQNLKPNNEALFLIALRTLKFENGK